MQGSHHYVGNSGSEHHPGYFDKKPIGFYSCWLLDYCRKHDFYDSYTFCSSRHKIIPIESSFYSGPLELRLDAVPHNCVIEQWAVNGSVFAF